MTAMLAPTQTVPAPAVPVIESPAWGIATPTGEIVVNVLTEPGEPAALSITVDELGLSCAIDLTPAQAAHLVGVLNAAIDTAARGDR